MIEYEITPKQKKVIGYIEENLNIKFKGSDKEQAQKFIKAHIEHSKIKRNEKNKEELRGKFDIIEDYDNPMSDCSDFFHFE